MTYSNTICSLLNEIREVHKLLPCHSEFPVHIEIFSSDNMVGIHQYVNNHKNMTMIRYVDEPNTFFDIELISLLSNYLKLLNR